MNKFIYADFIGSYVNICVVQLILQHIVAVFLNKGLLAQTLYETFEKCSILFKFKEGENFNHRNTLSILRITI